MNIDNYYNEIIKNFTDEDQLVDFLNKPDILSKINDDERETLLTRWLTDNGWVEINTDEDTND